MTSLVTGETGVVDGEDGIEDILAEKVELPVMGESVKLISLQYMWILVAGKISSTIPSTLTFIYIIKLKIAV